MFHVEPWNQAKKASYDDAQIVSRGTVTVKRGQIVSKWRVFHAEHSTDGDIAAEGRLWARESINSMRLSAAMFHVEHCRTN